MWRRVCQSRSRCFDNSVIASWRAQRDDDDHVTDVDEYHFVKHLGQGAFAEVSLVVDTSTGKHFAVKCFDKSLLRRRRQLARRNASNPQDRRTVVISALDQVEGEVAIMMKFVHPNLCQLYEVIDDDAEDSMFMVLEVRGAAGHASVHAVICNRTRSSWNAAR